jgi:quercetin dioxygenase-like cupin family protein
VTHLDHADLFSAALERDPSAARDAHLSSCEACLREVLQMREIGVRMALSAPSRAPRPSLFANVSSHLRGQSFAGFARRFSALFDLSSSAATEILARIRSGDAFEAVMPGMRAFAFDGGPRLEGATCLAARFEAGSRHPLHRHRGDEHVLVLAGAYRDCTTGDVVGVGDIAHMPAGTEHTLEMVGRTDCIAAILMRGGCPEYLPGG